MGRSHVLAIVISVIMLLALSSTALTDSPLAVRRQLQAAYARLHGQSSPVDTIRHGVLLRAPVIDQMPTLYNGCEVTSAAMLLQYFHIPVSNLTLASAVAKDPTPLVTSDGGNIVSWGNPNEGFVGSITGASPGYGVYHHPIAEMLARFAPHRVVDLTGKPFAALLAVLHSRRPIMVWTTINFEPVATWVDWTSPSGPVRATMLEHAVLLVGYDRTHVFVNDPLSGVARKAVPLTPFLESWRDMGKQAITLTASARQR